MHKPNNRLEGDVKSELGWDPILDSTKIIVKADDGRVTLSGAVTSYYDSLLASEDALSVSGVKVVDNELMVGLVGESIADVDVATARVAAFDGDRLVPKGVWAITSAPWPWLSWSRGRIPSPLEPRFCRI